VPATVRALNELMPLVYEQLWRLAARQLRGENHNVHGQVSVHEAYLKLVDQHPVQSKGREHFFALGSHMIRRGLVTQARSRNVSKRGSGERLFDEAIAWPERKSVDPSALYDALERCSRLAPQQGRSIELCFFGALSIQGAAFVLGTSPSPVSRDWNLVRAGRHRGLSRSPAHGA
jgi:RNA polymerase sigma factor (TIGR02999 family)